MRLLRCTDGRSAEIPDWLYDEYHVDPCGEAIAMPLDAARHHNRARFDCVVALAETAAETARALHALGAAHRVTK